MKTTRRSMSFASEKPYQTYLLIVWIQITEEIASLQNEIYDGSISLGKFKEVTDHVSVNLC